MVSHWLCSVQTLAAALVQSSALMLSFSFPVSGISDELRPSCLREAAGFTFERSKCLCSVIVAGGTGPPLPPERLGDHEGVAEVQVPLWYPLEGSTGCFSPPSAVIAAVIAGCSLTFIPHFTVLDFCLLFS